MTSVSMRSEPDEPFLMGTLAPNNKASTRQEVLRTVRTYELVLDQFPAQQMPALQLSLSRLHLDYMMLICVICKFVPVACLFQH